MFRNHYTTIAAWIIVYISLWLSRDNLVSSKFSKNNCHTGFVSRIIETMIFPFQWYKNRPTYEYVVGLVLLCCISVVAVIKCFSVFSFYADALNGATGYGRRYASAGGADDP